MPSSAMHRRTLPLPASKSTRSSTVPPSGVNLMALLARFSNMRCVFSKSPFTSGTSDATRVRKATQYFRASGVMVPRTDDTMSPRSMGSHATCTLPASERAMSSMSFIMVSRIWLFFSISSHEWRSLSRSGGHASRDICANVMMDVSGVRSSWFTMDSRSDLNCVSSASFSFRRSRASRCCSRATLALRSSSVRLST